MLTVRSWCRGEVGEEEEGDGDDLDERRLLLFSCVLLPSCAPSEHRHPIRDPRTRCHCGPNSSLPPVRRSALPSQLPLACQSPLPYPSCPPVLTTRCLQPSSLRSRRHPPPDREGTRGQSPAVEPSPTLDPNRSHGDSTTTSLDPSRSSPVLSSLSTTPR